MKQHLLLGALLCAAVSASAQVTPKVAPEVPENGKSYILVNKAQTADQYTSRTSWDGALYFLGKDDSHYADYALTAVANENGTWSFTFPTSQTVETGEFDDDGKPITETIDGVVYMAVLSGGANVKATEEPAEWKLDAKDGGFFNLIAGEGNNPAALAFGENTKTGDIRMHLNNGKQYFVTSYLGDSWFPDCFGGITNDYDEAHDLEIYSANDSITFNWGFVSPERIDDYYADMKYVGTLNSFYSEYCEVADYADGFLATFNAAKAIYDAAESVEALENAGIADMLNAKVELYKTIDNAILVNEAEDAKLAAAINEAINAFNTLTDAEALLAEVEKLVKATEDYSLNTGDFTSYGKNMSFEDLSAQGGNQTSGVAGAPAGWNVYINGKQAVTADDVKAGGIGAWHGVNNDAEGEPMDGAMAFGLWNGSVPDYEISQTINGLENGTYTITAGLMAGSNGGGSRLSTQRIFGNLNSTYYGSESDYNIEELDQSELYDFAWNEILTTDRIMMPVTVRAYVYDGTLTFGVRTNGNASAAVDNTGNGGTGWFKVDNFRIASEGYIAADAMAILDHYLETLRGYDDVQMMPETVFNYKNERMEGEFAVDANSPAEKINKAIVGAKDLIVEVTAAVKAYDRLRTALDEHYENIDKYDMKAGFDAYLSVLEEVGDSLTDSYYEVEDIDAAIARLEEARFECIASETVEEGMELTERIINPSFEDLSAQGGNNSDGVANPPAGWSIYVDGVQCKTSGEMNAAGIVNWCAINAGDNLNITNINGDEVFHQYTDGEHLWGIWASAVPALELSQTVKGLPAGTYTLTVDMVVQNDWAGMNLGTQRIFANDYVCMYGAEEDYVQTFDDELFEAFPADIKAAKKIDEEAPEAELKHLNYAGNYVPEDYGASGAPYTTALTFGVAERGDIKIGVRTSRLSAVTGEISAQQSLGWFKIDNWTLVYDSAEVPAGAEITGISSVTENAGKQTVEFYSISGARLSAPQRGVNIVKMGNDVKKVIVK